MKATAARPRSKTMQFAVRPLRAVDVQQSSEIERDAFPTLFPPTPFRRELNNRNVSFLVAWRKPAHPDLLAPGRHGRRGRILDSLSKSARGMLRGALERGEDFISGFLGTWYMVDEAHIITVGVRNAFRGSGIGELLVIAAIEQAMDRQAAVVTLEVRPSNMAAINLYRKYGFKEKGLRKGYYADNREDALIMTTDPLQHPDYRGLFIEREQEHRRRWATQSASSNSRPPA